MIYEIQNVHQSVSLQLYLRDIDIPGIANEPYDLCIDIQRSATSYISFTETEYFNSSFTIFPAYNYVAVLNDDGAYAWLPYDRISIHGFSFRLAESLSLDTEGAAILAVIIFRILGPHIIHLRSMITLDEGQIYYV